MPVSNPVIDRTKGGVDHKAKKFATPSTNSGKISNVKIKPAFLSIKKFISCLLEKIYT
ncbi:hypothetical protein SAE01_39400 [Segetibacter aerophilus]|uniref:Uncharacterized protein n=1 Tax=Segetibacter aerophilus TaxID=670293 RepID=A0A512BHJ9_9BACT|nr:hypothetical protein SAE01_39400 [Segetibacter aerophilus]